MVTVVRIRKPSIEIVTGHTAQRRAPPRRTRADRMPALCGAWKPTALERAGAVSSSNWSCGPTGAIKSPLRWSPSQPGASTRNPAERTAVQLVNAIYRLCNRNRDRIDNQAKTAIEETCRRLKQHEVLLRDVLPDLRASLTAAEEASCNARLA